MGRAEGIYAGPDGTMHGLAQPEADGPVVINPWPFQAPEIEVSVEATLLRQLQFADDAALDAALHAAPVETRCWVLRRS